MASAVQQAALSEMSRMFYMSDTGIVDPGFLFAPLFPLGIETQ